MKRSLKHSIILTAIMLAFIIIIIIPYLNKKREELRRISCLSNLHSMGLSFQQYAIDNGGHFPDRNGAEGLEMLRACNYLSDYKIYRCPSKKTTIPLGYNGSLKEKYVDYVYRAGLSVNDSPDSAIMWNKPNNHSSFGNIMFLDGHVRGYQGADWMKNIK